MATAPRASGFSPGSRVVILGGGLQGCSTAYFLRQRGFEDVTIVERTGIAASSSGKGGGFLARGWGDGGPTQRLHELSFDLHEELAETLGVESFHKMPTLQVVSELGLREWPPKPKASRRPPRPLAPWLDPEDTRTSLMDDGTAQVVPEELCRKLFENSGAKLVLGAVTGLDVDDEGKCSSVQVAPPTPQAPSGAGADVGEEHEGEEAGCRRVECDVLVVALGVWTVLLEDWMVDRTGLRVPLEGIYSSSMVFPASDAVSNRPYALFCAEDSNGCHLELYPRKDGSLYVCGLGGSLMARGADLREGGDFSHAASRTAPNAKSINSAQKSLQSMLTPSAGVDVQSPAIAQACMRPCAPDALPLMGQVPETENMFVAAGHNCWGILWAPVTGLCMAELIADGACSSVDLAPFHPGRFSKPPGKKNRKRGRHAAQEPVGEQW
uniref:FAD dependent oxidoreductase domain-containing protein n=1 Tax=Rhizochromulina marina TaxID=1034831 RepID=A0A7S2RG03_9STRA